MQPVLTHHTLNHLVLHLDTKTSQSRSDVASLTPGGQVRFRCVTHLVVWIWIRPPAGAVNAEEVVTVFIQTVDVILVLRQGKHTNTLHQGCYSNQMTTGVLKLKLTG